MRIAHCCLACFYVDNYGYQENILPRMHKRQGHDVLILASTMVISNNSKLKNSKAAKYVNADGIPVHRLPYKPLFSKGISQKLRCYSGLYEELLNFSPDVIFIHGVQALANKQICKYIEAHNGVKLYADCHSDFNNSAKSFLSKNVLHRIVYRYCARVLLPYISYYYGVLPARCEFLKTMYGIPDEKIKLLVMGSDDDIMSDMKCRNSRAEIRSKYCNNENSFLVVTGGKFNLEKSAVLNLMEAVHKLENYNICLLIFGSVSDELREKFDASVWGNVNMVGWVSERETYEYLYAADIVVLPYLHSVLWEVTVGLGVPAVFREIPGTSHVDVGGNCIFIKDTSTDSLIDAIHKGVDNINDLSTSAQNGSSAFSYYRIAQLAISE